MPNVTLNAYLFFDGTAREAMNFYKEIFGGDLTLQTFAEGMGPAGTEEKLKDRIMHGALMGGDVEFMGSDAMEEGGAGAGNISLSLSGTDEAKLQGYFQKLSDGGTVTAPLEKAPWGDMFGMLKDKFGIVWMVNITAQPAAA